MPRYALFSLLFLLCATAAGQQLVLDESHLDRDFLRFKLQLTEAILDKDALKIAPLLHHDLDLGYDSPENAREYLLETFRQGNGEYFWDELYRLISLGFIREQTDTRVHDEAVSHTSFLAPSYASQSFPTNLDQKLIITGRNVNIRSAPTTRATIIRQASWEVFRYHSEVDGDEFVAKNLSADGYNWVELVLPDGKIGYVVETFTTVGLLVNLRVARFEDGWKIVGFYHYPGC